jgi:hypothetical protein
MGEDEREWRGIVAWDWLVDGNDEHDDVLHAPGDIVYRDWCAEGTTACGRVSGYLAIPGLFSRMGAERCGPCCELTGMPPGKGSPKNDKACRTVIEEKRTEARTRAEEIARDGGVYVEETG